MIPGLHQVVPVLSGRDATGHHTLAIQRFLRRTGVPSEVFVVNMVADGPACHPLSRYDDVAAKGSTLLYQCSVGSPAAAWCLERREQLIVDYHNMTPASHFDGWHPGLAAALREGRSQLADLAARCSLAMADSSYNAAELAALGYPHPSVVPLLLDLSVFEPRLASSRRDPVDEAVWLCVGRLVPNKGQHRLLGAFAAWQSVSRVPGRLVLVGDSPAPAYVGALHRLAARLGVSDAVEFAGSVPLPELVARYHSADVFVSLSTHEGFCVPLVEAMAAGLPTVALSRAAVPETAAASALLIDEARPLTVAAAVDAVLRDATLRECLVDRGRVRAAAFSLQAAEKALAEALQPILE